jgi:hypothetical protein
MNWISGTMHACDPSLDSSLWRAWLGPTTPNFVAE